MSLFVPEPELVTDDPGSWEILPGSRPAVDYPIRSLSTSLDPSDLAWGDRFRALVRVRFPLSTQRSPRALAAAWDVGFDTFIVTEALCADACALHHLPPRTMSLPYEGADTLTNLLPHLPPRGALLVAFHAFATSLLFLQHICEAQEGRGPLHRCGAKPADLTRLMNYHTAVVHAVSTLLVPAIWTAITEVAQEHAMPLPAVPHPGLARALAAKLETLLRTFSTGPVLLTDAAKALAEGMVDPRLLTGEPGDAIDKMLRSSMRTAHECIMGSKPGSTDDPRSKGTWGKMSIKVAIMSERIAAHKLSTAKLHRDYGSVPRAMHRWSIDGQIFCASRRAPGATILLDVSGSMRISNQEIITILEAAPYAEVAMYSGLSDTGTLTIVARNGRYTSESELADARKGTGGNNVVDFPALCWLADHRRHYQRPLIWISDTDVTGVGDGTSAFLQAQCLTLCTRVGILVPELIKGPGTATQKGLAMLKAASKKKLRSRRGRGVRVRM